MTKLINKYRELFDYLLFGVLTTLLNVLIFYILNSTFNVQYLIANGISIIVSILFAFIVNKYLVFKVKTTDFTGILKEFIFFFSFRLSSGVIDMFNMWLLVSILRTDPNISKLITEVIVVFLNYLFSKFIVFKK